MLVQVIMTPAPFTVDSTTTIGDTMRMMHDHAIRHVPVVDDNKVVGLISNRDLTFLHAMPDIYPSLQEADVRALLERPITSIMKMRFTVDQDVITISPKDPVRRAVEKLILHRITALPVTDPDTGKLVGILSYVDVLAALGDKL